MQTVFLKDGTQANLITKTEKGYIVDPLEIYTDYETKDEYTEPSGNVIQVDKVYDVAPIPVIMEEYKTVLDKIEEQEGVLQEKRDELRKLEYEITRLKNTKTEVNRYIINREELKNAKRLIVFKDGHIMPRIMDGKNSAKFSVSYEISQYRGEEKCWSCQLHSESRDSGWSGTDYFDADYGIKVDLTDEEIKELTLSRLVKKPKDYFREYCLRTTPDEWLTPEFIEIKKAFIEKENTIELQKAEKELTNAKQRIDALRNRILTVS